MQLDTTRDAQRWSMRAAYPLLAVQFACLADFGMAIAPRSPVAYGQTSGHGLRIRSGV